jgi:PhnB protein
VSCSNAVGDVEPDRPAEIRIGDSLVMVSSADVREPFPAFLYIYVDDVGITYQRALDAGATSLEAPFDTPYGDRRAMVRDRFGNVYQIAHRVDQMG